MYEFLALRIKMGMLTIDEIPAKYREQVQAILDKLNEN